MATARALAVLLNSGHRFKAADRVVANSQLPLRKELFETVRKGLFESYIQRTPSFATACTLLDDNSAPVINDHVAFRSFIDSQGRSGLTFLSRFFTDFGYARQEDVTIPGMPVNATWLEPPETTDWPKVFISELRTFEMPEDVASIIYRRVDGYYELASMEAVLRDGQADKLIALFEALPFTPTAAEEARVREVSEYGAWTLTHAHRFNHATILLNTLGLEHKGIHTLANLNEFMRNAGLTLNAAGGSDGYTQGSRESHLEQSSTLADTWPMTFACGTVRDVPCSFLELIHRHDGFRGFLGQNAKGIFASTNQTRAPQHSDTL